MNTAIRAVAATLVAAVLVGVAFGQVKTVDPVSTIRLSGRLMSDDGKRMGNKTITLKVSSREERIAATTDLDGNFVFPAVRPNQHYDLLIAVEGYSPWVLGLNVGDKDQDLGNPVLQHIRPIKITGRLLGFTGTFLTGETITLQATGGSGNNTTVTDENGFFVFSAVKPEQGYTLRIAVAGFTPMALDVKAAQRDVNLGNIVIQPLRPESFASGLSAAATGKLPSTHLARISGRIVALDGVPLADQAIKIAQSRDSISTKTTHDGMFVLPIDGHLAYDFYPPEAASPAMKIVAVDGELVEFGNIKTETPPSPKPTMNVLSPVRITSLPAANPEVHSAPVSIATTVAVIFADSDGVHVVHSDGQESQPLKGKEQVGCSRVLFSEDNGAVGWLVDSDFCCTSYPISLTLVVYRPGKPLRTFHGDGRAIFDWKFVAGGKQVAFYQDFLHGTPSQHYELRNVESGRLVSKWDGDLSTKAPEWTIGMQH